MSADGIHFFKCTEKQTEAFASFAKDLGERSQTTTGVRLDFHTNSKNMKFRASSGEKFELLIDGLFRAQYKPGEDGSVEASIPLTDTVGNTARDRRVTLVFPSHRAVGVLDYIELDDAAYVVPHKFDRKFLFIGDSITQGWQTEYDTRSFAWRVSLHYNAESIINGVGGAFFHKSVFDKIDFRPDTVFVAYGTNDWGRFPNDDVFATNVREFLDLVYYEYPYARVFVISPIWRAKADGELMGERFNKRRELIEAEASVRGFVPVSGLLMVPPIDDCFADRYLHPNDFGFGYYYENLVRVIDNNS
jgi:hypothetical protein